MNFYEFQNEAVKTFKGSGDQNKDFHYLALGLAGEIGELANLYKKIYHGQAIREKYLEEAGDCLWYLAVLLVTTKRLTTWGDQEVEGNPNPDIYFIPIKNLDCSDFIAVSAFMISSQYNILDHVMFALGGLVAGQNVRRSLRIVTILTMELLYTLCMPHGITLEEIYQHNVAKLRERHGEKYNPEFYQKEE